MLFITLILTKNGKVSFIELIFRQQLYAGVIVVDNKHPWFKIITSCSILLIVILLIFLRIDLFITPQVFTAGKWYWNRLLSPKFADMWFLSNWADIRILSFAIINFNYLILEVDLWTIVAIHSSKLDNILIPVLIFDRSHFYSMVSDHSSICRL